MWQVRREAGCPEQSRRVGGVTALQLLRDGAQAGPGPAQQGENQEEGGTETRLVTHVFLVGIL